MASASSSFRELCAEHGIAVTHQREVLFETLQRMHGHPSPEEIYAAVREKIPSISLATVYKNIHLFVQSGVLTQLSIHHGPLRVEMNRHTHHHLVCSVCKTVTDLPEDELGLPGTRLKLSNGFAVERLSVDVIGVCADCQSAPANARPN